MTSLESDNIRAGRARPPWTALAAVACTAMLCITAVLATRIYVAGLPGRYQCAVVQGFQVRLNTVTGSAQCYLISLDLKGEQYLKEVEPFPGTVVE